MRRRRRFFRRFGDGTMRPNRGPRGLAAEPLPRAAHGDTPHRVAHAFQCLRRLEPKIASCITALCRVIHQKPRIFHQTLPTTAKISRFTTHITKPTRHQVPIETKPLPKMIGEVPVA